VSGIFDRAGADTHWAQIAERGTLVGLKLLFAVYRYAGRWLFSPMVAFVVVYFGLTSSRARRASSEYLNRVWCFSGGNCQLPRKPGPWTTFRHFYSFAGAILDKLAAWKGDISIDEIDHVNLQLFESRYRRGRGGIWITSHLGNIEVCRAIGQQDRHLELTVLMHTRHASNFNRILQDVAPHSNVELLEVSEFGMASAIKLQQRISDGRFIIIVGDRTPVSDSGRSVECEFLGRKAKFPAGPFLLASVLDCPAGTLFCVREGKRFRMFIEDLPGLQGVRRKDRDLAIDTAVRLYAARLEALCQRYPLQWFNFFSFWGEGQ
jgi:predicted LPLAT superfamily acyltransferase